MERWSKLVNTKNGAYVSFSMEQRKDKEHFD